MLHNQQWWQLVWRVEREARAEVRELSREEEQIAAHIELAHQHVQYARDLLYTHENFQNKSYPGTFWMKRKLNTTQTLLIQLTKKADRWIKK